MTRRRHRPEHSLLDLARFDAEPGCRREARTACRIFHPRRLQAQVARLRHRREVIGRQAYWRQPQNFPRHARIVPAQRVNRITNRRAGF